MFVMALDGDDDGEVIWELDGETLGFMVSSAPPQRQGRQRERPADT